MKNTTIKAHVPSTLQITISITQPISTWQYVLKDIKEGRLNSYEAKIVLNAIENAVSFMEYVYDVPNTVEEREKNED